MSMLGSEMLHTQGSAHMMAGDFLVPFMMAVERGAGALHLDLEICMPGNIYDCVWCTSRAI
jgi:hypothetical protein